MFNQAPQDNASLKDRFLSGLLVREQLERIGLSSVADFFNQPRATDVQEPSVTITRRRGRPFTQLEAAVIAEEDQDNASALLGLTRQLKVEAAAQAFALAASGW